MGSQDRIEGVPFRLLVYFKRSIETSMMENLLTRYYNVWDAVFLVNEELVILNKSLPVTKRLHETDPPDRSGNKNLVYWKDIGHSALSMQFMFTDFPEFLIMSSVIILDF